MDGNKKADGRPKAEKQERAGRKEAKAKETGSTTSTPWEHGADSHKMDGRAKTNGAGKVSGQWRLEQA